MSKLTLRYSALLLATLCIGMVLPAHAQQPASDALVSTLLYKKNIQVKNFTPTGQELSKYSIKSSSGKDALVGNWNGSGTGLATVAAKRRPVVTMRDQAGRTLAALTVAAALRNIHSIFAVDVDNSGADDLVVVEKSGNTTISFNPGLGDRTTRKMRLGKALDYAALVSDARVEGFAARANTTRVDIFDLNGTKTGEVGISNVSAGGIFTATLEDGNAALLIEGDNNIGLFSLQGARLRTIANNSSKAIGTARLGATANRFGTLIKAGFAGALQLVDLALGEVATLNLAIVDPSSVPVDTNSCSIAALQRLAEKIQAAINSGDMREAQRLLQQLRNIQKRCGKTTYQNPGPDFITTLNNGVSIPGRRLIVKGGEALACNSFLEPRDGNKKGFLIKNGDYNGRIVAVTPSRNPDYEKLEILDTGYGVIESLKYSGKGNGDPFPRQHWRGKRSVSAYPDTLIVRGTLGAREDCWRVVRSGATRID